MTVSTEKRPDGTCVVIANGRIDQDQTPQLSQALTDLLEDGFSQLTVNLSEATYINSGGLRCLVTAWRQARQSGGDLTLCGLNDRLDEIITMVGFDKVFRIEPRCD